MWTARSNGRVFLGFAAGLVAVAWAAIVVWGASPYSSYLEHESLADVDSLLSGPFLTRAALFVAGWSLMTVAMMLPTAIPLVSLFRTMTRARPNPALLAWLLIAGYVVVWLLFGVAAFLGDFSIHAGVEAWPWLDRNSWLISAGILTSAGLYQFTPLKYYCLDKCRSPYGFMVSHWHGANVRAEAFRLGVAHGLFCVGCCWSIMLLMFALGMGNIAWMAAVAVAMGIEKNMPWGRRLTPVLGVVLVTAGVTVLFLGGDTTACAC